MICPPFMNPGCSLDLLLFPIYFQFRKNKGNKTVWTARVTDQGVPALPTPLISLYSFVDGLACLFLRSDPRLNLKKNIWGRAHIWTPPMSIPWLRPWLNANSLQQFQHMNLFNRKHPVQWETVSLRNWETVDRKVNMSSLSNQRSGSRSFFMQSNNIMSKKANIRMFVTITNISSCVHTHV